MCVCLAGVSVYSVFFCCAFYSPTKNPHKTTAFDLYNLLRWLKFLIVVLCALLLILLLIDDFRAARVSQEATQRSTWRSQQAGYVVIIAMYVAALAPSVPDYPATANLRDILPECGYAFNDLIQNIYGGIMGFIVTALTMQAIVPVGDYAVVGAHMQNDHARRNRGQRRRSGPHARTS